MKVFLSLVPSLILLFYCTCCVTFVFVFQVIKETLSVVPVHLETRGLLETAGPQVMIWF